MCEKTAFALQSHAIKRVANVEDQYPEKALTRGLPYGILREVDTPGRVSWAGSDLPSHIADATIVYPIISGHFDDDPVVANEQIPGLRATLDLSVERVIEHRPDGSRWMSARFKVDFGHLDDDGNTNFGGTMFYRLSMPIQSVGSGYRVTTGGAVLGSTVFPLIPYPAADWNRDGVLDSSDISAYLISYTAGEMTADMNGDEALTTEDIMLFESFHDRSQGSSNE